MVRVYTCLNMDSSRADELVRQAEKKLSSFSFFGLKKAENYDAAAAMLEKAGTQYKLSKRCERHWPNKPGFCDTTLIRKGFLLVPIDSERRPGTEEQLV